MDLTDLDALTFSEAAQRMIVQHPATGDDLKDSDGNEVALLIRGDNDPSMKRLDLKIQNQRLKKASKRGRVDLDAAQIEAERFDRAVASVAGWENIFDGKKPLECNPANVKAMLQKFPWMEDQIHEFRSNEGNFLKG
jgi:hypothetical protein